MGAVDGRVVEEGLLVTVEVFVTLVVFDGLGVSFKLRGVSFVVLEAVFGMVGVLGVFNLLPVAGRVVIEGTLALCKGVLFGVPIIWAGRMAQRTATDLHAHLLCVDGYC